LPPHDADGVSAAFRALNQGKESLALDLKSEAGRDLLLRLVDRADVLVEGFRPGVLERLGVGADVCRTRNPRLIWCAISGYGQDGPYRDRPGHDANYMSYAGALGVTGGRDGVPVLPGLQAADTLASLSALSGILLALCERVTSGTGRLVDASMLDAAVSVQGFHFANHKAGQPAGPRAMALNGGLPCYDTYATLDGRAVALGALEPKFWGIFCEIVGKSEWSGRGFDPALRDEVSELFRSRSFDEWRVILENTGCCLSPVLNYEETLADPQVQHRGLIEETRTGPPVRFQPPLRRTDSGPFADRAGAHSRAVLAELLGLGAEELDALGEQGVVGS
jgi:crotonobetainyl-CoA:carnitine CoA-transferase CaiB-like acyl-CoA transferase